MESTHDVIVGTVVGFAVVLNEGEKDEKIYQVESPQAAFDLSKTLQDGMFAKLLQTPTGEQGIVPGLSQDTKLGETFYSVPCADCGSRVWWEKYHPQHTYKCEKCSSKYDSFEDILDDMPLW